MLAQIQDNTYKAYVALQSYATAPTNIPIPGVIRTDRPKLTREQMADRYLKSVAGNTDIDINKKPKMYSKERSRPGPLQTEPQSLTETKKRSAECDAAKSDKIYSLNSRKCGDRYFDEYKRMQEKLNPSVSVQLIGRQDPECVCIAEMSEFVVCDNKHLASTEYSIFGWPRQYLDYRNALNILYSGQNNCTERWTDACLEPETSRDKIFQQVDHTLATKIPTRIFVHQNMYDEYLNWRKLNGTLNELKCIVIRDKINDEEIASSVPIIVSASANLLGFGMFMALTFFAGLITCKPLGRKLTRLFDLRGETNLRDETIGPKELLDQSLKDKKRHSV